MADATTYPKTASNTVNRYKHQATYDVETIHEIVNSSPFVHVSFVPDPSTSLPIILPMIGQIGTYIPDPEPDSSAPPQAPHLYLHTSISSRLASLTSTHPSPGLPLCIAATHLSGLVLSLTPYSHNYNYRSAVLQGAATLVSAPDEKLWAMRLLTNSVVPGRWEETRVPPTKAELTSTAILKFSIETASAKVREGGPEDERWDMKNEEVLGRVWTGVVPVYERLGTPAAGPYNRVKEVPGHIGEWVAEENERREREVVEGAKKAPPVKRPKKKDEE
ncbi:putative flavin-nucleotide-binding protein [Phaeosphaeria sp. MPI-PUGE-AT-0046c]|nr:putative flavin-nucleotide-binding protein [Phaeosphaeria sp. MPI-PUGE-AT-0046c]